MKELVKELQETLIKLENIKALIKQKETEFATSIVDLVKEKPILDARIEELKKQINEQVLQEYDTTKNKSYIGGLGVQERKKIMYDVDEVFKWALDKKMFLSLDTKAFEKVAESLKDVPTVEVKKEPQVTYPKEIKLED